MEAFRSTTGERSLLAIVAGAGVGGLLSGMFVAISSALTPPADLDPVLLVAVTVAAALVWLVFILVLGVPVWGLLHHFGKRSATTAAVTGLLVTFFGKLLFTAVADAVMLRSGPWTDDGPFPSQPLQVKGPNVIDGYRTLVGWQNELIGASLLAIAGVIVGLVIWRIAYRTKLAGA